MNVSNKGTAIVMLALFVSATAYADFEGAMRDYNAGRYEAAHAQFLALAELGDCSSQFNLGAMALKGQGGPKDAARGVGWLQAAAGNGCEQLVGNKLSALSAGLSPQESQTAAAIVARYGREALRAEGVVNPDFRCPDSTPASVLSSPTPDYPHRAAAAREPAIVITAITIGVDGLARDPEVLVALPGNGFAAAAIEAWLNSRFTPATRNGRAVESRLQAKTMFAVAGAATYENADAFRAARTAADAGDPQAQYLLGLTATLDPSLGISSARSGQLLLGSARGGDSDSQYWVGSQLRATSACHPHADGDVWLRHAAAGGNASAQVLLAADLLRSSPSAAQSAEARGFLEKAAASDSYYVRKHVTALLAASPVEAVRDPRTALAVATELAAGDIQSDPQMFEAIAAAHAANQDFHGAVTQQSLAVQKAQQLGWDTRAMNERLSAYRHDTAWRGELLPLPVLERPAS
ncbi:MAG TPA: energy transducer TonB [Steroidobacteraceae bacterium]|nr:energy transducer TonB [Steroidobacteraceae bacterium]